MAFRMKETRLTVNKPVLLGMCILDISKTLMYDFRNNYFKPKYARKAKLLFIKCGFDQQRLLWYVFRLWGLMCS